MTSNLSQPDTLQFCYENVNRSCIKSSYSPASRVILYTGFGFGSLLAIFGNFLVMMSVLHFKQLHSPANFLIASLACADFLVGATLMPFSMVRSVESCWYFGARFCALHSSCDVAFCYSSLFHLSFISIDRYVAVTDPLVYPPSSQCLCQGNVSASPGSCPLGTVELCPTQVSVMMGWRN